MTTSEQRAAIAEETLRVFLAKDVCGIAIQYLGVFRQQLVRTEDVVGRVNLLRLACMPEGGTIVASSTTCVQVVDTDNVLNCNKKISRCAGLANNKVMIYSDWNILEVWDLTTHLCVASALVPQAPSAIACLPDGFAFWVENILSVWRYDGHIVNHTLLSNSLSNVHTLCSSDKKIFAGCAGEFRVVDLRDGYEHHFDVKGYMHDMVYFASLPDGEFVSVDTVNTCWVWDLASRSCLNGFKVGAMITCACYIDGCLVFACEEGDAQVWDVKTGKLVAKLGNNTDEAASLTALPNGQLAVALSDNSILFFS